MNSRDRDRDRGRSGPYEEDYYHPFSNYQPGLTPAHQQRFIVPGGPQSEPKAKNWERAPPRHTDREVDSRTQEGTLTIEEIRALRSLLQARERSKWLWGSIKLWLSYLSAGLITLFVLWEHLEKFFLRVFQ